MQTHILQVDANEADRRIFAVALRLANPLAQTHAVPSAEEGINSLEGRQPYSDRQRHPMPNGIFLGLILPGMSGLEFLTWRRESPFTGIPCVVVLTGILDPKVAKQAVELGASAVLRKPVTLDNLVSLIVDTLQMIGSAAAKPPRADD